MSRADLFQLVQIVYWLALATWFGGVLFVAMAVPAIFRTVGENNPVLPHVLSVNLEGQHGTLLSGSIVGSLLARLARVQLICGKATLTSTPTSTIYSANGGRVTALTCSASVSSDGGKSEVVKSGKKRSFRDNGGTISATIENGASVSLESNRKCDCNC